MINLWVKILVDILEKGSVYKGEHDTLDDIEVDEGVKADDDGYNRLVDEGVEEDVGGAGSHLEEN